MIDADKSDPATAARSHLKKIIDFPRLRWWQMALEGDTIEPQEARHHKDKWRWWMNNQVFGSIEKHIENPDDLSFLLDWHSRIGELLGVESCL